jgi:chromosome segregation and condensation protein ScpB
LKSSITNLIRANVIPGQRGNEIKFAVLHIITQLFDDETSLNNLAGYGNLTIQEKSPLIFAYLIGESCDLQKAAMDTNAIIKLSKIIENITAEETVSVTVGKTAVAVEFDDLVISKTKNQGPGRERLYEVDIHYYF